MRLLLACGFAIAATTTVAPRPAQAQADRLVILVRHAEKAAEPRDDPHLSDAGRERAKALGAALASVPVSAVIVTQFRRTHETAAPVLSARGLTPIVPAGSGFGAHVNAVADSVRAQPPGSTILVVGHSNTIPAIIGALGGPKLKDLCDNEYATLFVLDLPASGAPRLIRASYGAADPPGATTCTGNSM
jgi:broad specificity phosphatase PhoE